MQAPETATPEAAIQEPQAVMPTPDMSAQSVEAPTVQPAPAEYPNAPDVALDPAVREKEVLAQEARQAYYFARDKNPDEYAKAEGIARRTGIPLTSVLGSMDLATRIDDTKKINFDQVAEQFPGTAQFLSDPRKAAMVHDDVPGLTAVEGAVAGLKYVFGHPDNKNSLLGDTLGAGFWSVNQGLAGIGQAAFEVPGMALEPLVGSILPENPMKGPADAFAEMGRQAKSMHDSVSPPREGVMGGGIASGLESSGMMATLLPLAMLNPASGAALMLGTMAGITGGQTYGEDTGSKHINPLTALGHGLSDSAIEYATEKLPVGKLADILGGKGAFMKKAAEFMVSDLAGEQLATLGQDFNAWMVANPEKSLSKFLDERPGAAAQTLIATLVGGGVTVATTKAIQVALSEDKKDTANAERSEAAASAVNDLIRSVQATKTLQRDPETISGFVDQQLQEGVKNVYINGEMLAQSDLGQMLAQGSSDFAAAMAQAADIGGEVAVPIASLSALPDVETLAAPLADHFRVENEKFTRAEAQEFMATHEQSMKQEIERVLTEVQNADQFRTQIDEVKQVFVQQLDATGRYDSKANDVNATLVANFFGAQAARFGMTPMDLYKAYEYKVQAAGQAGEGYSQALLSAPPKGMVVGNGETASQIFNKVGDTRAVLFDNVTDKVALEIPDLAGFSHSFALSAVDHIIKNHGNVKTEKQRGQIAITSADTSRIPDIVSNYDSVHTGQTTRHGLPIIAYVKSYADGTIVYLEELRNKRKDLAGLTMWKYPATVDAQKIIKSFASDPNVQNVDGHDTSLDQSGEDYKQGERGGFNPATFTTTLFKGADLSTFLHESGHFFLEMQMDMAAKLQNEAEAFGGMESMTPGQQEMMRDTAALLKWFGVRDLTEWHGMTLDEKRVHHEQFARSFETYLYEGKAPSIELDSAFQTFRSWLANVYRAALDMVRGDMTKALDVQINDEVRGVMDRMLATTEQIKLAENARSMMPLFNSPQEAGMTQEEFAAYHLLSTDAT